MTTNTMINDAAMENAAGGITASEYWDGMKYLLFGDEYENYIHSGISRYIEKSGVMTR